MEANDKIRHKEWLIKVVTEWCQQLPVGWK